jgi:3-dehydroquinate synthase
VERDDYLIINHLSYPVYIGANPWDLLKEFVGPYLNGRGVFILTDLNTQKYCLPVLIEHVPSLAGIPSLAVEPGEQSKDLMSAGRIWNWLMENNAGRKSLLINLGGGVISDLGGFSAATFKRGMPFINIPTSLIGQADAAIGGKTGINHSGVKNQAGVFADPSAVFVFPAFLRTLPSDQIRSGFAEILKSALLAGNDVWERIRSVESPYGETDESLIIESVKYKAKLVSIDPYDHSSRKALNFGHTAGHAIESFFNRPGMPGMLHGDAVAEGMVCEAFISSGLAGLPETDMESIISTIIRHFPVKSIDGQYFEEILSLMEHDKKKLGTGINFSLLKSIGHPVVDIEAEREIIFQSFRYLNQISRL